MQRSSSDDILSSLRSALHDVAQPMTTLRCRLEIAKVVGDQDALQDAVNGGLVDLDRMTAIFEVMRSLVADISKGDR